jgi:hypothetical protein
MRQARMSMGARGGIADMAVLARAAGAPRFAASTERGSDSL